MRVDASEEESPVSTVVASVHNAPENRPTERVLEAMDNSHKSTASGISRAAGFALGPRDVDVERVIRRRSKSAASSRSTASPTGSTFATSTPVRQRRWAEARRQLRRPQILAQNYVESGSAERRGWLTKLTTS
jgi:hypothetical protein